MKTKMTARERWLAVLRGEPPDRVPMDYQGTPEMTRKMMAYLGVSIVEELYARLHVDVPLGVGPAYCGPALAPGSDMYGNRFQDVNYGDGSYEECVFSALAQYETVDEIEAGYTWPAAAWFDYSVIPAQLAQAGDNPVMAGLAGIYTLYTRLRGMEQAFVDFAVNHDLVLYCMEKLVDLHYEMAVRTFQAAAGRIDIAGIANDMGSQLDLLFSLPTIRKALPDLIEAGVQVFNPVQWRCKGMERAGLKRDFGDRLVFHGGVDNQYTLFSGTVDEVREEVRENIAVLGAGGGYILAPCHALQTVSPPENVVAMYEAGLEYGS